MVGSLVGIIFVRPAFFIKLRNRGDIVSFEAIRSIAETEARAEDLRAQAAAKAKQIVAEAAKLAAEKREKLLAKAKAANAEALKASEEQAAAKAKAIAQADAEELKNMIAAAGERAAEAENMMYERITKG